MDELDSLRLFKRLIKDGCVWHGDVLSRKWSEQLFFNDKDAAQVHATLLDYEEGKQYKVEGNSVWIA